MPEYGPSTRCVRLPRPADPATGAIAPPVHLNAAFEFPDLESWRAAAVGERKADLYSRNTNPTCNLFEEQMAALEGAEDATSFATGMAAISATLFALLKPGDKAVTVRDAYGATFLHFTQLLPRFGVECVVLDTDDEDGLIAACKGARLVYLETPTNPALRVLDIRRLAHAARDAGAVSVVDNTFATPINQRPLDLGADLVLHSATKFLAGHNDVMAGVVCGSRELVRTIFRFRELTGPALDPMSAFLVLRSLKTLALRMERHNANAMGLARFLQARPEVKRVCYPGLPEDPGHGVAQSQMSGFGGVLSFELHGGLESARRVLPRLKLAHLAANLGQVDSVVGPTALTSHLELSPEEIAASKVPEGLIRYSAGIEDLEDLVADLSRALTAA